MRSFLLSAVLFSCGQAFMEDILRQMGGGGFQFQMGGEEMHEFPGWPRGISGNIHKEFDWMKGTVWNWNNWRHVTFEHDGNFKAPTEECEAGACKWASGKKKIFIMWGKDAGLHILEPSKMKAEAGVTLRGKRKRDGEKVNAIFERIDEEAAALHKDLYKVLGLDTDATDAAIKKAYRKLSVKYHPDKNKNNPEAAKTFNEIREAYEVLSDQDKKFLYETAGLKAVRDAEKEDAANAGQQHQGGLEAFFGGGQQRQKPAKAKKGASANMEVSIPLDLMYNSGSLTATFNRRVVCRNCRTSSSGKCKGCSRCPGTVKMVQRQMGNMIIQQQEQVQSKEKCKDEDGELVLEIERGMDTGSKLTFPRMNEQTPGEIPGDVVVTVKQKKHDKFRRKGKNLYMDMDITMKEALLGFSKKFTHMDDREVTVSRDRVTQPDTVHQVRGEGMPVHNVPSDKGDLFITLKVKLPRRLDDKQKKELEKVL
mmetsp:Transcript_37338/g.73430  ORF Transcript_37338/g.73430 Transcript_37338/m.73430 type:complete len:480 (+) Transcript_37338:27-1466(+)|eukprot:CAMPEP_0175114512 /NCGR_PEP_ID=MMETSP0086_2-20121207/16921_1 /TAXON_ID=136419 /ORGANISM="Unknown Unknown, Strain D1" /LENGTH=479 /DNA_ID=CAMNT_0016394217 /DNA_START=25 /DNA_END=1464 /DNA_ORIENTATION=+